MVIPVNCDSLHSCVDLRYQLAALHTYAQSQMDMYRKQLNSKLRTDGEFPWVSASNFVEDVPLNVSFHFD